jgi:hypothetical protein
MLKLGIKQKSAPVLRGRFFVGLGGSGMHYHKFFTDDGTAIVQLD